MSGGSQKEYKGQSITVTFDARPCLHAAEYVHGLPEVPASFLRCSSDHHNVLVQTAPTTNAANHPRKKVGTP